ncbi:ABC transporter permease [Streptomyces bauhiniae]|uniref:ABC transporter permease n=1 Tax=Streptomyces bauhiniae TaxID=2340725 RepID=A0A4Z1CXV0_9ACTN|nr:ABC transporter permease [Streptomyces bauhiniae]TGN74020.1 ABC transporter permease [Streptomyces bauhiniae]
MSSLSVSTRWTFRLHRWALIVWGALVVAIGGLLLWAAGPLAAQADRVWRRLEACPDLDMCGTVDMGPYATTYLLLTYAMTLLPFVVAAWAGATLTARELESGTALTAWTQGVSPVRWLAVRMAMPAVVLAVGASLLVVVHRSAWGAAEDPGHRPPWWQPFTFHANGPTTVAACLAALAVGALTGILVSRTLPALGITVGATALLFAAAHWLMPYLWPSVTEVSRFQDGYRGLYTGVEISHGMTTRSGTRVPTPECDARSMDVCRRIYEQHDGTGFYTTFHPASHFWPLQLTTTALLLLVTALLTAASFVVLRRRTG